jgi:hypothetical protein
MQAPSWLLVPDGAWEPRRRTWARRQAAARELHRAHTVSERLGEPQAIFRPSEKRGAHAQVEQRGQRPAPGRVAVGQPAWGWASSPSVLLPNGRLNGAPLVGCPTVGIADRQGQRARGAVSVGDEGVQPEKRCVALATEEPLCHFFDGGSVCFDRLSQRDGLQAGR